ncbi:hypothetical protein NDU88_000138 [Pleurodeles waltl]|uniref:Uncharacterized protein n=1 Tax=Pleurodeles waltl TaxID=8319 RepID=A0AAV7WEJ8_PLEWA|nr:hypothetical protein NDU88_000138 [Pleurodeles waltl]
MCVSTPDRVYKVTLQLERDIPRTIDAIFCDRLVNIYDILLSERDWPPEFVRTCPYGEEVIKPSFSPLVPNELAESYAIDWALVQAPELYRNHVGLGHQRVGIHVAGNTLADEAAKSAVATASVAAVTRSRTKPDDDIWAAVQATAEGTPLPKAFPAKYSYRMGGFFDAEVKIPGMGVR